MLICPYLSGIAIFLRCQCTNPFQYKLLSPTKSFKSPLQDTNYPFGFLCPKIVEVFYKCNLHMYNARWNHQKSFELQIAAPLTFWVPYIFQAWHQNFTMKYWPPDSLLWFRTLKKLFLKCFLLNSFFLIFDIDSFPRGLVGRDRFFKGIEASIIK